MFWLRSCFLLLISSPLWALEGYVVGGGVDADTENGTAATFFAELGVGKDTWISSALAASQVDLPGGPDIETVYADLGIDHWFKPVGIRAGVAYWGDSSILDSIDYRASVYWRNDKFSISGNYEYRDFTFDIFRSDLLSGRDAVFHANGVGISARAEVAPGVDLTVSVIDYDYNVDLGRAANRPIVDFLSVSRLSHLNSLIDYRGRVGLSVDVGDQQWSLDYATWKGEVDGRQTDSLTLRFLTPIGQRSDIEIGLGVDRSADFGSVTLLSVFLFFYG